MEVGSDETKERTRQEEDTVQARAVAEAVPSSAITDVPLQRRWRPASSRDLKQTARRLMPQRVRSLAISSRHSALCSGVPALGMSS